MIFYYILINFIKKDMGNKCNCYKFLGDSKEHKVLVIGPQSTGKTKLVNYLKW